MSDSKEKKVSPFIIVIFGGSGDLTIKKVLPSIFELYSKKLLPDTFYIYSVARSDYSADSYKEKVTNGLKKKIKDKKELASQLSINRSALSDNSNNPDHVFTIKDIDHEASAVHQSHSASEKEEELIKKIDSFVSRIDYMREDPNEYATYQNLENLLKAKSSELGIEPCYLFYLATPPVLYEPIILNLAQAGLHKESLNRYGRRIIIEKPYGRDLDSAMHLEDIVKRCFNERQIFRIDHYLGKETTQNILVFRFSNGIFEPLWNRNYISYVEITAVEKDGVLNRGKYYDSSGALRDMVQNHLLQILGLVAMEPPVKFEQDMFRNEMDKIIESLRPIEKDKVENYVIRGQYMESDMKDAKSYRDEEYIKPLSKTETYVAMKLYVDNWRWYDVPFYIRTGKAMPTKATEIVIHFKTTPFQIFKKKNPGFNCNRLVIRVQPDEGIVLQFGVKKPGDEFIVQPVTMDFKYDKMKDSEIFEAYSKLILNCLQGDAMLFSRSDIVKSSWKFIDPILKAWEEKPSIPLYGYPYGTWWPLKADSLMTGNLHWSNPCKNLTETESYCLL